MRAYFRENSFFIPHLFTRPRSPTGSFNRYYNNNPDFYVF